MKEGDPYHVYGTDCIMLHLLTIWAKKEWEGRKHSFDSLFRPESQLS